MKMILTAAGDGNISLPFSWSQLLLGLLAVAGIVAVIALIVLLIRLAGTVKKVNKLLSDNAPQLDETIKKIPSIATSADETLSNVNNITGSVNDVVTDVKEVVDTFTTPEGAGGIVASVAGAVVSVLQVIREMKDK